MRIALALWTGFIGLLSASPAEPVPLNLGPRNHLEITRDGPTWTVVTTGKNPHFWTSQIPRDARLETHPILSFDYFATSDLPNLRVRVPYAESAEQLSAGKAPFSETWRNFGVDLRLAQSAYASGANNHFAIILGTPEGHRFQLRNLCLRAPTAEEERSADELARVLARREADSREYEAYLRESFAVPLPAITVEADHLLLRVDLPESGLPRFAVAEFQPHHASHQDVGANWPLEAEQTWRSGPVELRIPRFAGKRDRSTSRFKLAGIGAEGERRALSAAAYPSATGQGVQRALARQQPGGIKGLGAFRPGIRIPRSSISASTTSPRTSS